MTPAEASAALKATHAHWRELQRFDRRAPEWQRARAANLTLTRVLLGFEPTDDDIADAKAWAEGVSRG